MSFFGKLFGRKEPQVLTVQEYVGRYADFIRAKNLGFEITIQQGANATQTSLHLSKDGAENSQFMGNWYSRYLQQPAQLQVLFEEQFLAMQQVEANATQTPSREIIFPVVKTKEWYQNVLAQLKQINHPAPETEFVIEPLAGNLLVSYVADSAQGMSYVSSKQLGELGVATDELRELALRNLRTLLPQLEIKGGEGRYAARLDRNYDATMMLLFNQWRDRLDVSGDPVMAVPARDELLICGSEDAQTIASLREMADRITKNSAYSLSNQLFVYRNGRFEVLAE